MGSGGRDRLALLVDLGMPAGAAESVVVLAAALVLARADRLELIDTIFTFDDSACAFGRTQRLEITAGEEDDPLGGGFLVR